MRVMVLLDECHDSRYSLFSFVELTQMASLQGLSTASSLSATATLYTSPKPIANSRLGTFPQAFVVHFENVLVPTKWMTERLGLSRSAQGIDVAHEQFAQSPELQLAFHAIEGAAIQLLQVATAIGPVFLVSDTTSTYAEVFCSVFFPRLTALLNDSTSGMIRVVGASSASLSLAGRTAWKIDALRAICCEKLFSGPLAHELLVHPHTGRFGLVCLNSHEMDAIAAARAQQTVAPHVVLKMCQVASSSFTVMELEQFHAQLERLARFTLDVTAHDGPVQYAF